MLKMMRFHERVVSLLQRPPEKRLPGEIDALIPWFQHKSKLLKRLDTDLLHKIILQSEYQVVSPDTVIMKQGQNENKFYLILSGYVFVYFESQGVDSPGPPVSSDDFQDAQPSGDPKVTKENNSKEKKVSREKQTSDNTVEEKIPEPKSEEKQRDNKDAKKSLQDPNKWEAAMEAVLAEHEKDRENKAEMEGKEATNDSRKLPPVLTRRVSRGRLMLTLGRGDTFGELSLIELDSIKNATVVAEEKVELMVVSKSIYNKTLKRQQESDYNDRREFLNKHSLFSRWPLKLRRLLEASLQREIVGFNEPLAVQGQPATDVVIIKSGRGTVLSNHSYHLQQYPRLRPFSAVRDVYWVENLRPVHKSREKFELDPMTTWRTAILSEKSMKGQVICAVEIGEIVGDIEMVANLDTYTCTVLCSTDCEVFRIDRKQIEKIIRKNGSATNEVKAMALAKVSGRAATKVGQTLPLFGRLAYEISIGEVRRHDNELPAIKNSKHLPDDDLLFLHQLDRFRRAGESLGPSYIKGGIYYRDIMNTRARDRAEKLKVMQERLLKREMGRQLSQSINISQRTKVVEPPKKIARSILTLKTLLKQELEEEEQEKKELKWRNLRSQEKSRFNNTCNDVFKKISNLISSARPPGIERGKTLIGMHNYEDY